MISPTPLPLPAGITSNYVDCPQVGLRFHYLEAGYEPAKSKKLLLLLHGYPELAFSWRKVMPSLADAGYHVVAPDQRGYGRTTGWDNSSWGQVDLRQFTMTSLVRDLVVFVHALGFGEVACVIGHDFGAVSASMAALMRPDLFKRMILMSHPYKAVPSIPFGTAHEPKQDTIRVAVPDIVKELAELPEPRKHYRNYNSSEIAASDWIDPPQGLKEFLRGYIHIKSANWARNKPHPLSEWSGKEMAKMPFYYIMPAQSTMPAVTSELMQGEDASITKSWLPDDALDVYVQEWQRTGFQGALNWYRTKVMPGLSDDLLLFAGKSPEIPTKVISGAQDWGNHQEPGALDKMKSTCTDYRGAVMIQGAGHWPQQEQPDKVVSAILDFLQSS